MYSISFLHVIFIMNKGILFMFKLRINLLLIFSLFFSVNSYALEFNGPFKKGKLEYYTMVGSFDNVSYKTIREFLEKKRDVTIVPFSNGGSADAIFPLLNLIKNHNGKVNFDTTIDILKGKSYCRSMCAWMASAAKSMVGEYSFHGIRVYNKNKYGSKYIKISTTSPSMKRLNTKLKHHLVSKGVRKDYAEEMAFKNRGFYDVICSSSVNTCRPNVPLKSSLEMLERSDANFAP